MRYFVFFIKSYEWSNRYIQAPSFAGHQLGHTLSQDGFRSSTSVHHKVGGDVVLVHSDENGMPKLIVFFLVEDRKADTLSCAAIKKYFIY